MEKSVILKRGKEESLKRFHPWIFSGAIQRTEGNPEEGDIVTVYGEGGGTTIVYDYNYHEYSAPCVNVAYATLDEAK